MSTPRSLSSRPRDFAMFIYFAAHIPITMLMDIVRLYPAWMAPVTAPLVAFCKFYVDTFKDPFIADPSIIWFSTFLHLEALYQLPMFFYASWAIYNDDRRVSLPICIYAAHVLTTVLPCLTTLWLAPEGSFVTQVEFMDKVTLSSFYAPWVLFPCWMLYNAFQDVRQNERFGQVAVAKNLKVQ